MIFSFPVPEADSPIGKGFFRHQVQYKVIPDSGIVANTLFQDSASFVVALGIDDFFLRSLGVTPTAYHIEALFSTGNMNFQRELAFVLSCECHSTYVQLCLGKRKAGNRFEQLPVKRTEKKYNIFPASS